MVTAPLAAWLALYTLVYMLSSLLLLVSSIPWPMTHDSLAT